MKNSLITTCAVLITSVLPSLSLACPPVSGLPDYNCDGEIHIAVLGDSLVYGTLDTENDGKGGYVLRAQQALPEVKFHSYGYPGVTTRGLLSKVNRAFSKNGGSALVEAVVKSDMIVLDVGRNDDWSQSDEETASDLKKLREEFATQVHKITGQKPLIVTAVLMVTKKVKKGHWLLDLNQRIKKSDSKDNPADLRFDLVPHRMCGEDRIHPTSKGYEKLSKILVRYITTTYPKHVDALRKDVDSDGLYDQFELTRFGTSPSVPDTDGDGIVDGADPDPLVAQ